MKDLQDDLDNLASIIRQVDEARLRISRQSQGELDFRHQVTLALAAIFGMLEDLDT